MLRSGTVSATFGFTEGATVKFSDTLEVEQDCCICHRCWRTVIFTAGGTEGHCTPTRHVFPGKAFAPEVTRQGAETVIRYRLDYWYEPFEDAKYPGRTPTGMPTWARISFEIVCPNCSTRTKSSVQNNTALPWTCYCDCGRSLYTQVDILPVLSTDTESAG